MANVPAVRISLGETSEEPKRTNVTGWIMLALTLVVLFLVVRDELRN